MIDRGEELTVVQNGHKQLSNGGNTVNQRIIHVTIKDICWFIEYSIVQ